MKIEEGENPDEVKQWTLEIEGKIAEVTEIEKSLYVDDIITWGDIKDEVVELKDTTVTMFEEAKFELHKWHSNETELEVKSEPEDEKQSNAKDRIGVEPGETKLLGLPWNKSKDTLSVPQSRSCIGRKGHVLAGKLMYWQVCDQRLPWDVTKNVADQWLKFEKSLPDRGEIPRSITTD